MLSLLMATASLPPADCLGKAPEALTLKQRMALAGKWIALELYTPETLPLKLIDAIGDSAADCIRQLEARGQNPRGYEFSVFPKAF
jgi:hypothetical protein